eukprot:1513416-Pleurochrysis_carterae.AAC.1
MNVLPLLRVRLFLPDIGVCIGSAVERDISGISTFRVQHISVGRCSSAERCSIETPTLNNTPPAVFVWACFAGPELADRAMVAELWRRDVSRDTRQRGPGSIQMSVP